MESCTYAHLLQNWGRQVKTNAISKVMSSYKLLLNMCSKEECSWAKANKSWKESLHPPQSTSNDCYHSVRWLIHVLGTQFQLQLYCMLEYVHSRICDIEDSMSYDIENSMSHPIMK